MKILDKSPEGGRAFDPYFVPDDWARLQYGRMLWKRPATRNRLLRHWSDVRHPYRERFLNRYRPWVELIFEADPNHDDELDFRLREAGYSLRAITREIPPVFGGFY